MGVAKEEREMYEQRVQRSLEAMSRKDLGAMMRPFADEAVFELAGHTSLSGRYEGKAAIEGLFRRIFERLEIIRFTVKHVALANPVGFTYNNTVFVESEVAETSKEGVTIRDQRIAVYQYHHGKVVSVREWAFDPTVIEAIWGHVEPTVPA
jgi:ketosteroid isomerase-like protein